MICLTLSIMQLCAKWWLWPFATQNVRRFEINVFISKVCFLLVRDFVNGNTETLNLQRCEDIFVWNDCCIQFNQLLRARNIHQYLSYECYNKTSADKAWSQKTIVANQFSFGKSLKHLIYNNFWNLR